MIEQRARRGWGAAGAIGRRGAGSGRRRRIRSRCPHCSAGVVRRRPGCSATTLGGRAQGPAPSRTDEVVVMGAQPQRAVRRPRPRVARRGDDPDLLRARVRRRRRPRLASSTGSSGSPPRRREHEALHDDRGAAGDLGRATRSGASSLLERRPRGSSSCSTGGQDVGVGRRPRPTRRGHRRAPGRGARRSGPARRAGPAGPSPPRAACCSSSSTAARSVGSIADAAPRTRRLRRTPRAGPARRAGRAGSSGAPRQSASRSLAYAIGVDRGRSVAALTRRISSSSTGRRARRRSCPAGRGRAWRRRARPPRSSAGCRRSARPRPSSSIVPVPATSRPPVRSPGVRVS